MPFDGQNFEQQPVQIEAWRTVLLDAADYIEAHGWLPETANRACGVGDNGEVCPAVAVVMVASDEEIIHAANDAFERWAGKCFVGFNIGCKSAAQLTAALRACAAS